MIETLIETIVKPLVDHPDDVKIVIEEYEMKTVYLLHVHEEDMGKIIGKQGRVIKSIRSIVYAAVNKGSKRVYVDLHEVNRINEREFS